MARQSAAAAMSRLGRQSWDRQSPNRNRQRPEQPFRAHWHFVPPPCGKRRATTITSNILGKGRARNSYMHPSAWQPAYYNHSVDTRTPAVGKYQPGKALLLNCENLTYRLQGRRSHAPACSTSLLTKSDVAGFEVRAVLPGWPHRSGSPVFVISTIPFPEGCVISSQAAQLGTERACAPAPGYRSSPFDTRRGRQCRRMRKTRRSRTIAADPAAGKSRRNQDHQRIAEETVDSRTPSDGGRVAASSSSWRNSSRTNCWASPPTTILAPPPPEHLTAWITSLL